MILLCIQSQRDLSRASHRGEKTRGYLEGIVILTLCHFPSFQFRSRRIEERASERMRGRDHPTLSKRKFPWRIVWSRASGDDATPRSETSRKFSTAAKERFDLKWKSRSGRARTSPLRWIEGKNKRSARA